MITGGALKPKQKESSGLESHWYVTGMPLESLKQIMPVVPLKIHEDTTSRPLVCHWSWPLVRHWSFYFMNEKCKPNKSPCTGNRHRMRQATCTCITGIWFICQSSSGNFKGRLFTIICRGGSQGICPKAGFWQSASEPLEGVDGRTIKNFNILSFWHTMAQKFSASTWQRAAKWQQKHQKIKNPRNVHPVYISLLHYHH